MRVLVKSMVVVGLRRLVYWRLWWYSGRSGSDVSIGGSGEMVEV